ncbi:hypothetical protein NUACC21_07500 [Scytonema sp. NUACC21]
MNLIWVTLFSWLWLKEKLNLLTASGIGLALLGGVLISLSDVKAGNVKNHFLLDEFLALMGARAGSSYLLLGREAQRRGLGIGAYVTVAYTTANRIIWSFVISKDFKYIYIL